MDKFAVETLLYSADFGDDNYLLASSSSSESDDECSCSIASKNGYMELTVPHLSDYDFKRNFSVTRKIALKVSEIFGEEFCSNNKRDLQKIKISKPACVFLWYLGNTETLEEISEIFKISTICIEAIIKLGVKRISARSSEFIFLPPKKEYARLANLYRDVAGVKGTIGSMGVFTFQRIKQEPDHEDSQEYHVLGTVTPNLKFIDIVVCSEGGIYADMLKDSDIAAKADEGLLDGYTLLCDKYFPQRAWLRPPYPTHQSKLNHHHAVACSILPQAVKYLKEKFRRLQKLEGSSTIFLTKLITSACVIHNMCIDDPARFLIE